MDFIKPIQDNWAVVAAAPWAFVAFILIGLLAGRFWQNGVVSILTSRLALKDDRIAEYERKLGGASPDEARQMIEALERRLLALEPRSLTPDQLDKMGAVLAKHPGLVQIVKDMGSPESARIHIQVEKIFRQKGWQIMSAAAMGVSKVDTGILIRTRTGDQTTESAQAVMDAFSAAGLAFDRAREPVMPAPAGSPVPPMPDLEILFTDFSPQP
ncbi:hypothetical protein [Mesorhizobium caraganae]|uniref:hypothetical protein n=1 Tax=Mesorhizobium caraganae TaxID=483206 RepID=UPI00177FCC62|nr:hypothetical protein [Mesorhizobium caraganae]